MVSKVQWVVSMLGGCDEACGTTEHEKARVGKVKLVDRELGMIVDFFVHDCRVANFVVWKELLFYLLIKPVSYT